MDAVQFGRWVAERRHLRGWPSQRALVDAVRAHHMTNGADISEAFLARLEAGHLAHPFRGAVRQRVLKLAWLLCKTARDLRIYLQVAGLTDLGAEEEMLVERLQQRLGAPRLAVPRILPPVPSRFVGREAEVEEVARAVGAAAGGVVAITGLPGVGKSALAHHVTHRLAGDTADGLMTFADGVVYQNVAECSGLAGLATVLDRITSVFAPSTAAGVRSVADGRVEEGGDIEQSGLRRAVQGVRRALERRHVLIVLDDAEPAFLLREALDALLPSAQDDRDRSPVRRAVLLTTSYLPSPTLIGHHLHVGPLAAGDALTLFTTLVRHPLTDAEREHAALICAAVGHLPLAIEVAATAIVARGIPIDLLATQVSEQPLDLLLDGDGELHAVLARALERLNAGARERFALLGALGAPTFSLEWAASLASSPAPSVGLLEAPTPELSSPPVDPEAIEAGAGNSPIAEAHAVAAITAAELGQLVRHCLLDATPGNALASARTPEGSRAGEQEQMTRYHLHPLLAAYARELLTRRHADLAEVAHRNAQEYALAYVQVHQSDARALELEREMALATLTRAWKRHEYAVVVRLVSGLWRLIGRLESYELSARILFWGISASQRIEDNYHQARFLNRLGALFYYHGDSPRARQTWEASLRLAELLRQPADVWHPLANLALLACEAGDMERARRCTDLYLRRGREEGALSSVAHALFNRGLCAHLQGDTEQARADMTACTRLLALRSVGDHAAHDGVFELAAQAELARVQGDVARARHHTEMAVALAEQVSDHYAVADLLLDQARFAQAQRQPDEARTLASRVVEVATRIEAHQLREAGLDVLRALPAATHAHV